MKTQRPIPIIIAAILLALLAFSNFPTRVAGAGFRGNLANRPNRSFNNNGTQNFPSDGSQTLPNDGTGNLPSGGAQNFNQNGTRFRQQGSILGIRSGILLQLGLLALNLVFLILGLAAALGLFQLKRWGLVLGLIVVAYNLIMAERSIYTYISFMNLRASGAFGNFGAAGGVFPGFGQAFPILAIAQIVVAIAVAVLALLPVSRKAFVVNQRPVTTVA